MEWGLSWRAWLCSWASTSPLDTARGMPVKLVRPPRRPLSRGEKASLNMGSLSSRVLSPSSSARSSPPCTHSALWWGCCLEFLHGCCAPGLS